MKKPDDIVSLVKSIGKPMNEFIGMVKSSLGIESLPDEMIDKLEEVKEILEKIAEVA